MILSVKWAINHVFHIYSYRNVFSHSHQSNDLAGVLMILLNNPGRSVLNRDIYPL
jgi:hypothetical protein